MEPALDVLDRALRGDQGSLSFLERTASIYVLDATKPGAPTTYGCWNFINQALNEVERYEARHQSAVTTEHRAFAAIPFVHLDAHVQLLATMSRRAARRSPDSDRQLIGTCIANAAQYHPSAAVAQSLIDLNSELRERVMGRIAAIAFDFSFHRGQAGSISAFSHPVAMENVCAVIAANSVSTGPDGIGHLIMDWIVPSVDSLPPFAVAAVSLHLAREATSKAAPAGTKEAMRRLSSSVIAQVLAPLLADAISESDASEQTRSHLGQPVGASANINQRLAALVLRGLDSWCSATDLSVAQMKHLCNGSKVDLVEILSDSMYSDAEIVVDALAELLETLLQRNAQNASSLEGISIARALMQSSSFSASPLISAEEVLREEARERNAVLTEFVSAVALQRLRFTGRQSDGDVAACRCLARIASSLAIASQTLFRSGQLQGTADGMIDLLLKAAAHPSVHICGIALEALPSLLSPESDLSIRLLTVLQRRAIVPHSLVGVTPSLEASDDCGVDFHEFENFREQHLSEALVACYVTCRGFYMDSCASAVEEFCGASTTVEVSFQLEAALFCLSAVALDASKRALLMYASPAAQAAALKASSLRKGHIERGDIDGDARLHDDQLRRCTHALAKKPVCATSNPLTLAQMCRFLGKYANWYSKSNEKGLLDTAADLALSSFNLASTAFRDDISARDIVQEMTISPYAEAATALRNILSRSPAHFTTPNALAALGGGWESSYTDTNQNARIPIEDREALCSGICRVLASLSSDQWVPSLSALARPTIEYLETLTKRADDISARANGANENELLHIISKSADEIRLLATMTRTFNNAMDGRAASKREVVSTSEHPTVTVLRRVWPCLSHVADKLSRYKIISSALGDFLTAAVSTQKPSEDTARLLKDLSEMAAKVIETDRANLQVPTLSPMLQFVKEVVDVFGHNAELSFLQVESSSDSFSNANKEFRHVIERLLLACFEAVRIAVGDMGHHVNEQVRGQRPFESVPEPKQEEQIKSPDALSEFFLLLLSCEQQCPVLLVRLSLAPGMENEDIMYTRAIVAAASSLSANEIDTARSAMLFLKEAFELNEATRVQEMDSTRGEMMIRRRFVGPVLDRAVIRVRRDIIATLIRLACGICPREVLDPAASLLHSVLRTSPPQEAESAVVAALGQDQFALGDEGRNVSIALLGKSARGESPPSQLMDFFSELWQLHQSDDERAVAGGDVVMRFVDKYRA